MADKTIGDLTQAASIGGEDLFVLEQGGEAKKLQGSQLIDYVTMNVISVTVETLPAGSQATATYNEATGTLSLGIPQGEQGNIGPANTLTIGTVTSGAEASATITGEAPNQVLNLVLQQGEQGDAAPTITGITIRQSDYHMIVTLSDGTSYDAGYCRGASGAGTGDMIASIYDPHGKAQDVYAYTDDSVSAAKPKSVPVTLTASGWVDRVQTVAISGVLADETAQLIQPVPALTSQAAYIESGILCTGQAENSLTFTATTAPTDDLTVYVVITGVTAG